MIIYWNECVPFTEVHKKTIIVIKKKLLLYDRVQIY